MTTQATQNIFNQWNTYCQYHPIFAAHWLCPFFLHVLHVGGKVCVHGRSLRPAFAQGEGRWDKGRDLRRLHDKCSVGRRMILIFKALASCDWGRLGRELLAMQLSGRHLVFLNLLLIIHSTLVMGVCWCMSYTLQLTFATFDMFSKSKYLPTQCLDWNASSIEFYERAGALDIDDYCRKE